MKRKPFSVAEIDGPCVEASGGQKYDQEKTRWDLLEWKFLEEVADVMTFGAKKYEDYNWQKLSYSRMFAAALRHITKTLMGEKLDPETGKSHLAHAVCELMFMWWKDNNDEN